MKLKLSIFTIALLLLILSCEKNDSANSNTGKDLLEIVANKTIMQADGIDEIEFSVFLNKEELVYGYKIICDNIPIEGKRFATEKENRYSFVATYGDVVSNVVRVQSVKAKIPEKPTILSNASKSLITFVKGNRHYTYANNYINSLLDNELTQNKFVLVTAPNIECKTNFFPWKFYVGKIGCDRYPYMAINHDGIDLSSFETIANKLIIENEKQNNSAASIGINSILENRTIITRVLLKAKIEANYCIGAFLVEDDITFSDDSQQYDAIIRHIDAGDYVFGHEVGKISKDATSEYVFIWNLDDIRNMYNATENQWSEFVYGNLKVIVYIYTKNDTSSNIAYKRYQFNNTTEALIEIVDR